MHFHLLQKSSDCAWAAGKCLKNWPRTKKNKVEVAVNRRNNVKFNKTTHSIGLDSHSACISLFHTCCQMPTLWWTRFQLIKWSIYLFLNSNFEIFIWVCNFKVSQHLHCDWKKEEEKKSFSRADYCPKKYLAFYFRSLFIFNSLVADFWLCV